jgi:hypothetical protein
MENNLEVLRLGLRGLADDASRLIDDATDLMSDEAASRIQMLRLNIETILSLGGPSVETHCAGD